MPKSIENTIKNKIYGHGRGWCFIPSYFRHIGSDDSVRKALSSLEKKGIIRRVAKGIYDFPIRDELLGKIPTNIDKIAKVIADKNKIKIQPSGAHAANLIGFDNQVPASIIYLTDGYSKNITIDGRKITFKKTSPKNMTLAGTKEGLLLQALRHIGEDKISEHDKLILKKNLNQLNHKQKANFINNAPAWIRKLINQIKDQS